MPRKTCRMLVVCDGVYVGLGDHLALPQPGIGLPISKPGLFPKARRNIITETWFGDRLFSGAEW